MQVKWKCVWRVLKPKIIAAAIISITAIITIVGLFLLSNHLISTQSVNYNNINMSDSSLQVMSTGSAMGWVSPVLIIGYLLVAIGIIGVIFLGIEYLKSLAEALKPCIIWEKK